jgi:uridylate kinase
LRKPIPRQKQIVIAAGMRPGASTDLRAVQLAKKVGAQKVINLSNIDYVYTKDPQKYKTAEKIKSISWKEFRKIIPTKWNPGLNTPFDPVASKQAQYLKMEVAVIHGDRLNECDKYLEGKNFLGTLIHS